MIDQALFNELADKLVEEGKPVSYSRIRKALKEHNRQPGEIEGKGASDRDLQDPYREWRQLRGYKGHLAALKLPESMEKLIASFAAEAIRLAEAKVKADAETAPAAPSAPGLLEQVGRLVGELDGKLVALTEENRRLQDEVTSLREAAARGAEPCAVWSRSPGGRKPRGIAASTARHFWDHVARRLAAILRKEGPKSIDQLVAAIDEDTKMLAAAAFERIDTDVLANRLWDRTDRHRYGLHREGDLYVVKMVRKDKAGARRAA